MGFFDAAGEGMGAGIGAQLVGGLLTNEQNQAAASKANEWQGDQIRSGREFQERMSSTAHQREVKDLIAAGLNPILSANAGASTPSASGGSPAVAQVDNIISPAIASAIEIKRMNNEIMKQKADIDLVNTQKQKVEQEAKILESQSHRENVISSIWKTAEKAGAAAKSFYEKNMQPTNKPIKLKDMP